MVVSGEPQIANGGAQRGVEMETEMVGSGGEQRCTEGNGKEPSGEKKANNAGDWKGKVREW